MAPPKKGKGKSQAESSSRLNSERFPDAESALRYESRFSGRTIIFERIVKPRGIVTTRFMEWIRVNRLTNLSNLAVECFEDWVREFYCNMYEVSAEGFKTYVRGKTLQVDPDKIATLLDIPRPRPEVRCFPCHEEDNIVIDANRVATVLCGRHLVWNTPLLKISELTTDFRLLNTFVCYNIEPRGHRSDLTYLQAFLLYSLCTATRADIPLTIFESMLRIYEEPRQLVLPFGAMICRMLIGAGCEVYAHEVPISKRQMIDARTMAMSDTHVRGRNQIGQAQAHADDECANSTEKRLSAVEDAVFDQSLQIEQLEERVTSGFSNLSNQMNQVTSGFTNLSNQMNQMFSQLRRR